MSRGRRRALLYATAIAAATGLLFAGYGITVPPDPGTRLQGAAFLAALGDTERALEACDRVLEEHPESLDARVFRATFLAAAGRHDDAARAYEEAIARTNDESVRCDLVLDRASGYKGARSRRYRTANEQVMHAMQDSYRDRRARKGEFRRLWIARINAAARQNGLTYSQFINGVKKAGITRVLFVGGAGSLEVRPGVQALDLPGFPAEYKQGALATREALHLLQQETGLEWSFLSPSADLAPGQRTGQFRLGKDQMLKDENGQSRISVEDYAVAMIDEVERPAHIRQRFTVGY